MYGEITTDPDNGNIYGVGTTSQNNGPFSLIDNNFI
jgi:hypothetical protein